MRFCAGCHGFNGIAYYVNSPSFALGERLIKDDVELERSIRSGTGLMPGWGALLSHEEIRDILRFVRTLPIAFETGIANDLNDPPPLFFHFRSDIQVEGLSGTGDSR